MKKALINGANANPGAPKDWRPEDGVCGNLPVLAVEENGRYACLSAWKPTPEELTILMNGGYVLLSVAGWQMPVALGVCDSSGAQELE